MSCVHECLNIFLSCVSTLSCIFFNENLNFNWLFDILLKEEQLQLLILILESANQIEIFLQIPLLKVIVKLKSDIRMFLSSNFYCLTHELFGKLGDISCKPAIEWEALNIFMRTEHYDEIFLGVYRTMWETDRNEYLLGLLVDEN